MRPFADVATLTSIVRRGYRRRRARDAWDEFDEARGALPVDHFAAVVYFADSLINLYQLQQWYEPLRQLSETRPVAIITRNASTALFVAQACPIPVVNLRFIADVEEWMERQPVGAVFYLNQNTRNFQMMRFRDPAHVFLSHGESEKDYMASNQLKAYDYTFIAGDAARDRLRGKLVGYDVDTRTVEIGRPQVDVHVPPPYVMPADDRTVVLYAPTWEGDRPSMSYSSVATHAEGMLRALVATGTHRVIYRPHPRTGVADPAYREAHERIVTQLTRANQQDPLARHIIDIDTPFGWHLDAAHVCIADISAVAFDWLATGKPIVLTEPASPFAEVNPTGIASSLLCVSVAGVASIATLLEEANTPERFERRAATVTRYFGDTSPGAAMSSWLRAATAVIAERTPAERRP